MRPLRVAIVAGERSGDALGAGLIGALARRVPDLECFGIAGEAMVAGGCEAWYRAEELSVMGLAEVLRHLPRLLRIRRDLIARLANRPPDVFIGIDSPDFNLPVALAMKRIGVPAVQYVSPQVWAWRQSRVKSIRRAIDLVLCVLPFETDFYTRHDVNAVFVGHPLADAVPVAVDRGAARARLGLAPDGPLLAILPGSRASEVTRLARPFIETARWLEAREPQLRVAVALASDAMRRLFLDSSRGIELDRAACLVTGRTREVLAASDVVLTASGTASLEAALYKRPMVVAYRLSWLTYWVWKRMGVAKLASFSLPNLLAGRPLVQEFLQQDVRAERLGEALLRLLRAPGRDQALQQAFATIHERLRCDANKRAADAVLALLQDRGPR
jgi:lipid-A-disaccharide synthase